MTRRHPHNHRRAFTLIELLATIMVLGLSMVAVLPVLTSVSDAAHRARTIAHRHHDISIALQRIAGILRESGDPSVAPSMLTVQSATEFRLASGAGIALDSGTLIERATTGQTMPLAPGITRFEVRYLRDDGSTTTAIPQDVHSVEVLLENAEIAAAMRVFLRGRMAIP